MNANDAQRRKRAWKVVERLELKHKYPRSYCPPAFTMIEGGELDECKFFHLCDMLDIDPLDTVRMIPYPVEA